MYINRTRCISYIVMVTPVLAGSSLGQSADVIDSQLDLRTLIVRVQESNPTLAGARLSAEALSQAADQVSSLPDPVFGITYQPYPVFTARGTQRSQWRIEQSFPFPGKRRLRGEIAALQSEIAAEDARALEQDLVLQATLAYVRMYQIQEHILAVKSFVTEVERFEAAAAVQYEVGRGPQQALLRAQLEKNALSRSELQLRSEWQQAARDLARLVNDPTIVQFDWHLETPPVLEIPPSVGLDDATANRPEIAALHNLEMRAERSIVLAKREYYPDFMLSLAFLDIASEAPPPTADGRNALAVGAGIKIPLWRGKLRANKEQAELEMRRAEALTEALQTDIATRINELNNRIQLEEENLNMLNEALIPQAALTRDATLAAYATGQARFIDLLDAERMVFELSRSAIDTRFRLHQSIATIYRVAGTSWIAPRQDSTGEQQ